MKPLTPVAPGARVALGVSFFVLFVAVWSVATLGGFVSKTFLADPIVTAALGSQTGRWAARAHALDGAPGRLFDSRARETALAAAERLLESALSGDRSRALRAAMAQGSTKARGVFSDTLDELTTLLATRARSAVGRGDSSGALAATRAIASVEQAKTLAAGNVSPAHITATLLRDQPRALT